MQYGAVGHPPEAHQVRDVDALDCAHPGQAQLTAEVAHNAAQPNVHVILHRKI